MIRVTIESPSAVARAGLRALLDDQPGIEFADLREEADVVIRDAAEAEDDTGAPAAMAAPAVLLLTDEPLTLRLLRAGVRGVLPQHCEPAQIVAAIQALAAGLAAVPWPAAAILTAQETPAVAVDGVSTTATTPGAELLTAREMEVLEMLAEGLSNKQIAGRLTISDHTAKFHVNSILGKLSAGTRTEAVTRGIRAGILKI